MLIECHVHGLLAYSQREPRLQGAPHVCMQKPDWSQADCQAGMRAVHTACQAACSAIFNAKHATVCGQF